MPRIRCGLVLLGVLTLAGCTRPEDYVAVAREQQKVMQEVTAILSKVHDAKDLAAAKAQLDDGFSRFDAAARKARALPQPPSPEAQGRLEDEKIFIQGALDKLTREVQRVQNLPDSAEFFKQYEGRSSWFRPTNAGAP